MIDFVCVKQAQVSSLTLEKQRLSSELDKQTKLENTNKYATGKCFHTNIPFKSLAKWARFGFALQSCTLAEITIPTQFE